jgi:mycothione reductase
VRAFDLIVIGAGSGNSIVDERFAHQRVAILDNGRRFGGTCLNYGCIPTKMFVLPADLLASPADAARVGVHLPTPSADWAQVRDRIFGRIDAISDAGQTWRADNPEVTLFRDTGRFVGPKVLRVGQEEITAEKIVIAAGSRAVVPSIPGLSGAFDAGLAHTSDTVMRPRLPPLAHHHPGHRLHRR